MGFHTRKLTDEGKQGDIREAGLRTDEPSAVRLQAGLPVGESLLRLFTVMLLRGLGVTHVILVAIEPVLERAVVLVDERLRLGLVAGQPRFGVLLRQRSAHDRDAFIDHGAVSQHQHRYGRLG